MKEVKVRSVRKCGKADVYNMEVDDVHNYSVNNGIIVHNCDALRYFVKTMQIARRRDDYKSMWIMRS